jgi:hypothetical protein
MSWLGGTLPFVTMRLLPGATGGTAVTTLTSLEAQISALGSGGATTDVYRAYMQWVGLAVSRLRTVVGREDLERLVLTRRHWALCGITDVSGPSVREVLNAEIEDRQQIFRAEVDDLQARIRRWQHVQHFVVADTCVYLEHKQGFESIPWDVVTDARPGEQICLVVPMVVLDELDNAKRGPKRGRAGYTLNRLRQVILRPGYPSVLRPAQPVAAGQPWTPATDLLVDLVLEDPDHVRLPSNDEEIIACSLGVAQTASPSRVNTTPAMVHVVTFDHAMAFRVRGRQGIHEVLLPDEDKQDQPERVTTLGEGTGGRAQRRQRRAPVESGAAECGEPRVHNDGRGGG